MRKDENGYIVVETIGTFIPFVLLMISILSLVNIVTVQARIHYALTQTANTLSMYSYVLEVLGIANKLTALNNKSHKTIEGINEIRNDINSVLQGIDSLTNMLDAAENGVGLIDRISSIGASVANDPDAALQNLMSYGVDELRNKAFEELVRPLVGRYLMSGGMSGDEYLKKANVINKKTDGVGLAALDFYRFSSFGAIDSTLIDMKGTVKLVVEYEIEYMFGNLPLPFRPTIHITQTVVTKAWLNGSGKGYW